MAASNQLIKFAMDIFAFLIHAAWLIVKAVYRACLPSTYSFRKDIAGEVALVTGGGSGLGRLLALRLAQLGATVVVWDINVKGVEETVGLVKGLGGKVYGFECDLANKEDVYRVAKKTQEEVGNVNILINNAGVVSGHLLLNTPDHLIQRTFDVNVISHFWTVKSFLPKMIESNHGHIVTIASMAGHIGVPKLVDYCASKYAAVGFDESLRVELEAEGVSGVRTTVVCPYFIQQTGMFDNVSSRFFPSLRSNDVADRVIKGILREEIFVAIPGTFKALDMWKVIFPWEVISLLIRSILPDAVPHQQASLKVQTRAEKKNVSSSPHKTDDSISSSVSQLNHRLVSTGKDL